MTKEELIDHLKHLADYVKYSEDAPALREAIKMLECSEMPNSSDAVSRQAAIAEFSCCELTPDGGIDANYAIDFLEQMPSAQPDLFEYSDKLWRNAYERGKRDTQPEIIRCKDCKHRPTPTRADEGITYGFSVEFPDERCPCQCEDGWYNWYPKNDFYCGFAERREE